MGINFDPSIISTMCFYFYIARPKFFSYSQQENNNYPPRNVSLPNIIPALSSLCGPSARDGAAFGPA